MPECSARLLIVDDDKENGRFLEEQFNRQPLAAAWFRDPREAVRQFRRDRYQVGILDLKMPRMDGVELFQILRQKDPAIGLIILTGYPSVDSALATLKTGAYDYVKKPFQLPHLKKVVSSLLAEKGIFLDREQSINGRVGRRIREFRVKRKWTVERLAQKADLSKSLISQIENARNSPSLESLTRLAQSLEVRVGDLVQDL